MSAPPQASFLPLYLFTHIRGILSPHKHTHGSLFKLALRRYVRTGLSSFVPVLVSWKMDTWKAIARPGLISDSTIIIQAPTAIAKNSGTFILKSFRPLALSRNLARTSI